MEQHVEYMNLALAEARQSPPKPTNFCVGACLVADGHILETGYTLECEGNTHAEQCCFTKQAEKYSCLEEEIGRHLPIGAVLYTTMEPCNKRSVGNVSCVDRILNLKRQDGRQVINTVYIGVNEPETFVGVNEGRMKLEKAGIEVVHVSGLEDEIIRVATSGHVKDGKSDKA